MECTGVVVLFLVSFVILETSILINLYSKAPYFDEDASPDFAAYDTNGDGAIDVWEFEAVRQRIDETPRTDDDEDLIWIEINRKFEELRNTSKEILKLKTEFTPLVLDSMTKLSEGQGSSHESMQALTGLQQWQSVVKSEAQFAVELFKSFLPKRKNINIGEPWMIISPKITKFGPDLSSDIYTPPAVNDDQIIIHYILQMFHPRPFIYARFPPQGTIACIRAQNNEFLDIEFRIHAEYQLNKPPLLPFWFSPAQFSGHLIIARNASHINTFEMEVPNNKSLNVDMEWLTGRSETNTEGQVHKDDQTNNMEVDIGYLPKMRVSSATQSYRLGKYIEDKKNDIIWDREISREEASSILEKRLYPFKEVPYLSFEKAYEKAKEEKKLVHSIVLWGALDDQSC